VGAAALALLLLGALLAARDPFAVDAWRIERAGDRSLRRAVELARRAESFDQRKVLAALPPSPQNGPSFRFDDHLEEARLVSGEAPGTEPPRHLPRFDFDGSDPIPLLPFVPHTLEQGWIKLRAGPDDALMTRQPLDVPIHELSEIEVRLQVHRATEMVLGLSKLELDGWHQGRLDHEVVGRVSAPLLPDAQPHTYRVRVSEAMRLHFGPDDVVRTLFLLPSNHPDDPVEVDYVHLVGPAGSQGEAACGRTSQRLGQVLRPGLYCRTASALVFPAVEVPAERPVLSLALGIAEASPPVTFEVTLDVDGLSHSVLSESVAGHDGWRPLSVDLSPFAGKRVDVSLHTRGHRGVGFWASPLLQGRPHKRQNVVVILEDALRADYLSLSGLPLKTTPVKDALAARGVVFERAVSQATKTRPSCPSLMTSLFPTAHGVWHFEDRLHEAYVTLAEVLRSQGYRTAAFTQNGNGGAFAGLDQGFDESLGPTGIGDRAEDVFGGPVHDWLVRNQDRNFFLYLHVLDPHGPYDPPEGFRDWYRPSLLRTPVARDRVLDPPWVEKPTLEGRRIRYAAEVNHNDTQLPRLLQTLESLGLVESTLLVFVADHGEHLGERGLWDHRPPGFTQVLHVPLILVEPGVLPAGRRIKEPVQLVDVMPTLLEHLGIPREPLLLQGDSLFPLLLGGSPWPPRLVYSEEPMSAMTKQEPGVWASIFFGRWHVLKSRLPATEVFDVDRDPEELAPLPLGKLDGWATRRLEVLMARLKQANMAIWQATVSGHPEGIVVDPEDRAALRALGYVE